jgi:hypothetical protein
MGAKGPNGRSDGEVSRIGVRLGREGVIIGLLSSSKGSEPAIAFQGL